MYPRPRIILSNTGRNDINNTFRVVNSPMLVAATPVQLFSFVNSCYHGPLPIRFQVSCSTVLSVRSEKVGGLHWFSGAVLSWFENGSLSLGDKRRRLVFKRCLPIAVMTT